MREGKAAKPNGSGDRKSLRRWTDREGGCCWRKGHGSFPSWKHVLCHEHHIQCHSSTRTQCVCQEDEQSALHTVSNQPHGWLSHPGLAKFPVPGLLLLPASRLPFTTHSLQHKPDGCFQALALQDQLAPTHPLSCLFAWLANVMDFFTS